MTSPPTITWSVASGAIGSINSTGLYTAPALGSQTDTIRATAGGLTCYSGQPYARHSEADGVHTDYNLLLGLDADPANPSSFNGNQWGMNVSTPLPSGGNAFKAGYFHVTQLITPYGTRTVNGAVKKATFYDTQVLDTAFVYAGGQVPGNPPVTASTTFADPLKGWQTDGSGSHTQGDSPGAHLGDETKVSSTTGQLLITVFSDATPPGTTAYTKNDVFDTYVMYLPPGSDSQWVPLKTQHWSYFASAVVNPNRGAANGGLYYQNPWQLTTDTPISSLAPFTRATTEPEWSNKVTAGNYFP
jgi:hypothetical protein